MQDLELGLGFSSLCRLTAPFHKEPDYKGKMVVIIAGYTDQMHETLERNPGMKSRFSEMIEFPDWNSYRCYQLVVNRLLSQTPEPYAFEEGEATESEVQQCFEELMRRPGWANARDAETMAEKLIEAFEEQFEGNNSGIPLKMVRKCCISGFRV